MTNTAISIEQLRKELLEARLGRLGDEMVVYMRILRHPEVLWKDLLDSLSRPEPISELAALALHRLLGRKRNGRLVDRDSQTWELELERVGVKIDDLLLPWVRSNGELKGAWEKFCNALYVVES